MAPGGFSVCYQLDMGLEWPIAQGMRDHAERIPDVSGLWYYPDFLTGDQQQKTIDRIDKLPWRNDLERRVQQYGWRYDYLARTVSRDMHIGPLPVWLQEMAEQLTDTTGQFECVPDQVIVNEYLPGQGIAMHVDRKCFGPAVATVSLGDTWRMELRPTANEAGKPEYVLLEVGSALVMTGSARFRWLHGIAKRKRERIGQNWRPRQRRISLTFRTHPQPSS